MAIELKKIGYSYSNREFSPRAVAHAFRFISALTGIGFVEDLRSPEIFRGEVEIPKGARVVLGTRLVNGPSPVESEYIAIDDDPVGGILRLVSTETKMGPFRDKEGPGPGAYAPKISSLTGRLIEAMARAGIIPPRTRSINLWPGNKRFGAAVTHDIDIARRSIAGGFRLLFKKTPAGHMKGLVDTFRWKMGKIRNPYDRVPDWIEIEKELGLISTYFVFAGERLHPDDPKYRLKDLSEGLDLIAERGSEIALHTGIECHDGRYVAESKHALEDRIKLPVRGTRPHYLSADLPSYWKKAAELGFSYSSCLGFDDDIGHYDGIDLPFFPFDKSDNAPVDLVEIPLMIMDCGMIGERAADSEEVINRGKAQIDRTAESGGLVVLDWHQRTLYEPDYPGWGRLFLELTRHMIERDAYIDTMDGIASLLRERMGENK